MLIYHFGGKGQLFAAALREVRARELAAFNHEVSGADGERASELLWRFRKHWTSDEWSQNTRLMLELWGSALRHPDRYGLFLEGIVDTWLEAFARLLEKDGMQPAVARVRARLVIGAMRGLELDLFTGRDVDEVDQAMRELLELVTGASLPLGCPSQPHAR